MYLIAAAKWKHPQNPEGISVSFQSFFRFRYIFCSVFWFLGANKTGRVYLFMCSCLWVYDRSGLCCCSVGAGRLDSPGVTVSCCFRASGGGQMPGQFTQSWTISSCRSTADVSFGYPYVTSFLRHFSADVLSLTKISFWSFTSQCRWTWAHKGKMDVSAILSQQTSMLT